MSEPKTILIIEDDHDTRVTLRKALEDESYVVASVTNGKDALDVIRSGSIRPAVILLDLMLPMVNGYDLLEKLRKETGLLNMTIIVITASFPSEEQSKKLGKLKVLSKPLNLPKLLEAIEEAVG
jgi:CheY-like chemotaxis protein